MEVRRFEKSALGIVFAVGVLFPSEAQVSGRNRTIPFDMILKRTQAFLVVDLASHKTRKTMASLPVPNKDPLKFEFDVQTIQVLDIVYLDDDLKKEPIKKGAAVSFVSIVVSRALTYQMKVAMDGSRKIMWYDQSPAFDEKRTGTKGLLLLKHYNKDLKAYQASMGEGILPFRYLDQIREHLVAQKKLK